MDIEIYMYNKNTIIVIGYILGLHRGLRWGFIEISLPIIQNQVEKNMETGIIRSFTRVWSFQRLEVHLGRIIRIMVFWGSELGSPYCWKPPNVDEPLHTIPFLLDPTSSLRPVRKTLCQREPSIKILFRKYQLVTW